MAGDRPGTDAAPAPSETRGRLRRMDGAEAAPGPGRLSPPAERGCPRCRWLGARDAGAAAAACGRAGAPGGSKVQGPAVPGRPGARGPAARPQPPACVQGARTGARERSAYHGTWSAGGGRGHDDRSCSSRGLSQAMVTARTPVCAAVLGAGPGGRLCGWCVCPTPRPLLHPSQGARHTPLRPGLCLS